MTLKYDCFLYPSVVKNSSSFTYPFGKTTGKQISLTLPLALPKAMGFQEGDLATFSKIGYAFLFFSNPTMLLAELDIIETAAMSMKRMYAQRYLLEHYLRQQKCCRLNVPYKAVLCRYQMWVLLETSLQKSRQKKCTQVSTYFLRIWQSL